MPIRRGLLSLLAREPMHGYQLRSEFDASNTAEV
jgi:DNA-binding PadR family transcriptional regulator